MGNLTQQHKGLAVNKVQPTTYTHKKLSNTTAKQKHCLPKGVQGFDLITGGKDIPLNLMKGEHKEGQLLTEPATPPHRHHNHDASVKCPKGS